MRAFWLMGLVVALGAGGCVPKSKYLEVQNKLDNCQSKLDKRGGGGGGGQKGELVQQLQPLIDKGLLEVDDDDGRTTIGMKAEVLFPSGSAVLSESGRDTVRQIGVVLARNTTLNWQVEGHTDNEDIHTAEFPDNWHLGAARAMAVLQVLLNAGMQGDRLSAATFGEYQPVASNASDTGRALNRRIEIVLLPEVHRKKKD
jgi:chemotaxis protein MotB